MAPRKAGRFRLTIRARITLSVALLIALGGGIIVVGLNIFMRYGPVWALPSVPAATTRVPDDLLASQVQISGEATAYAELDGLQGFAATIPSLEIRDASDVLGTLLGSSVIVLCVIVVLGSLAAWVLAGRVLSPLHEINAAARSATPTRLDRRVGLRGPRDELTDLSDTLDEMLERLEHAFRAQQLFAANASHELRTPLATEKAMLDMLLDGPEPTPAEYRAVAERLREVNRRSIAMGEALLELTRAQVGTGGGEALELAPHRATEILAEPLERARTRAVERDMRVVTDVTPHELPAKPEVLGRLLDNLLGNAIRHGVSGTTVRLTWRPEGDESVLVVRNSATPLDRETRERLHEPFVRGGGRVRAESGSGLGLAIAAAVAQAHGGTLRVLDPEGGAAGDGGVAGFDPGPTAVPGSGSVAGSGFGSATVSGADLAVQDFTVEVRLPLKGPIATLAT